jgi:hypothetical protein
MSRADCYLVECYWPGVSTDQLADVAARTDRAAAAVRKRGRGFRFLGSILVPADETVFCLFNGSEADVRTVVEDAGVPFERILESIRVDADGYG